MKIKFFKLVLPMAVITFGIAGAISTNAMNKKAEALVDRWGYTHIDGQNCVKTNVKCTTDPGAPCTFGTLQLYDFVSLTTCPSTLNQI